MLRSASLGRRPCRRNRGWPRSCAACGPTPTTSTVTPGKRSSASISVPMPESGNSRPTNRPPPRTLIRASSAACGTESWGPPSAGARRLSPAPPVRARRQRPSLPCDAAFASARVPALRPRARCGRAGGPKRRDSLRLLLLRSYSVAAPSVVARHPRRALLDKVPVGLHHRVAAIHAARRYGVVEQRAQQVDQRKRANHGRSPGPFGVGEQRELMRALHGRVQEARGDGTAVQRALHDEVMQHVVEGICLGARAAPVEDEELRAEGAYVP